MKPILITIAGGTASGKSTVVREIIKHFSKEEVRVICQDNYYKAQDNLSLEERTKINYDHPNSFDTDLMFSQLGDLLEGKSIEMPIYDFKEDIKTYPKEQVLNLVDYAVANEYSDIKKCDVLKEMTGIDIISAIRLNREDKESIKGE